MNLLRRTLFVNAATSGMAGAALVVGFGPLSDWLGIPRWTSLVLGIGLILFAVQVLRVARSPLRPQVVQVIGADAVWVVGAAAVIVVFPASMSTVGLWALGGVTAVVALFAVLQTIGLRNTEATA